MPLPVIVLLAFVIAASGLTVWLLTLGGPPILVAALPACLIAALGVRYLRK